MTILIDKKYRWNHAKKVGLEYWYIGLLKPIDDFLSFFESKRWATIKDLGNELAQLEGNYAFIFQNGKQIVAAVDKIRSYPIFYVSRESDFLISNSARTLKEHEGLSEIDDLSLIEFRMAGYVTGRETLYRDLYQMKAGEIAVWDKADKFLERRRYYLFYSQENREDKEDQLIEELEEVTNRVFLKVIENAKGAPVWIPLSGGLDSRVVLCKLKELKYDNLNAFSYGPKGNYEAKAAKHVSEKLRVPWRFIPSTRKKARDYFWTAERKNYWSYADGFHVVPNIHLIDSTKHLIEKKLVSEDAIFINGQSGDFIQGEHIPRIEPPEFNTKLLCDKIVQKHFSFSRLLLHRDDLVRNVCAKIVKTISSLDDMRISDYQSFAKLYELWEWQERQSKRVINGQRTYDYYGFSWELPLWDDQYLAFWVSIPLEHKLGRSLFRRYLDEVDFFGLFKNYKPTMSRWPGKRICIQYGGNVLKLLLGEEVSNGYYQFLDYFSQYSNFYAPFGYIEYLKFCRDFKGALPYFGKVWEKEHFANKERS